WRVPVASGFVTFQDSGVPLGSASLTSGVATFTTSDLSIGSHAITAAYLGDELYPGSTSAPLAQTVTHPADHAPVLAQPLNRTDLEGTVVSFALAAADPDGDRLRWSATGLPPGIQLKADGLIAGIIGFDAAGMRTVTVTVSDGPMADSK